MEKETFYKKGEVVEYISDEIMELYYEDRFDKFINKIGVIEKIDNGNGGYDPFSYDDDEPVLPYFIRFEDSTLVDEFLCENAFWVTCDSIRLANNE